MMFVVEDVENAKEHQQSPPKIVVISIHIAL